MVLHLNLTYRYLKKKVIDVMKILIIEDDKRVSTVLKDEIEEKFSSGNPNLIIKESGFKNASEEVDSLEPDAVILDISVPGTFPEEEEPGIEIIEKIWNNKFCPLIIYTSVPDEIDDASEVRQHPFVKILDKGSNSERNAVAELDYFIHHIEALNKAAEGFRNTYHRSMRHLAPYVFNVPNITEQERVELLSRSGKRRFAALCDQDINNKSGLEPWEQYIFPPLNDDLLLGDIIQKNDAEFSDAGSFRIILTPSCDLVISNDRKAEDRDKTDNEVKSVLVAKCYPISQALEKVSLKTKNEETLISRLLNPGYYGVIVPFPELSNTIPLMAANLKELDLIPIDKIAKERDDDLNLADYDYKRIASLDSPFRELISWAYQQVACRPGLPDRDVRAWAGKIAEAISQDKEK